MRNAKIIERGIKYMTIDADSRELTTKDACMEALAIGYQTAMVRSRTYSPTLFHERYDQTANFVEDHIFEEGEIIRTIDLWNHEAYIAISDILQLHDDDDIPKPWMRLAFIFGYQFGLYEVKKYDDCLLGEGHLVESCIIADLLCQRKKIENAIRARARIISNQYRLSKDAPEIF